MEDSDDEVVMKEKTDKSDSCGLEIVRILSRLVLPSITIIFIVGYVGMAIMIYNDIYVWFHGEY